MEKEIPLADIETIIHFCLHPKKIALNLSQFPWLSRKLSLFSRVLCFFGGIQSVSWQKKYLFPILAEAALPYLRRFCQGNWKAYEEFALKNLYAFFAQQLPACQTLLPHEIQRFLQGEAPSFSQERERSKMFSSDGMWGRNEVFSEYKKRLQKGLKKPSAEEAKKRRPFEQEPLFNAPLSRQTSERVDKVLETLHSFRDGFVEATFQLEKDFAKAFPVRYECEELFTSLEKKKETLFTLLSCVENGIADLAEAYGISGEERAQLLVERSERVLPKLQCDFEKIKGELSQHNTLIEEARQDIFRKISWITRSIDHVPLLPATSKLRAQQARIIRMARDKVKKFKEALSRGPGPNSLIRFLKDEVDQLNHIAGRVYEEGREIASMMEQVSEFMQRLESVAQNREGPSGEMVKALIEDVSAFQKTIEVSPDRNMHFKKIAQAISEVCDLYTA